MKRTDEKSFGGKMKQLRQAKKVSIEHLAEETRYSERYMMAIEEGTANPPVSAVIQIAKALAV